MPEKVDIEKGDKEKEIQEVESRSMLKSPPRSRMGSMRGDSRLSSGRSPSRTSISSRKVTRSAKKPRSRSSLSAKSRGSEFHTLDGDGITGVSESEVSDGEEIRTRGTSDIIEFGMVDIYSDAGWDTDLEKEFQAEEKETYDFVGKEVYMESCKQNGIIPASYFLRHMQDQALEMKHHGLGPTGVKPISVALVSNTTVLDLNLTDNWLGMEGGVHVCEMLKENCYITNLDLSDNRLDAEFAEKFIEVLSQNGTLTHIILTGNEFDCRAAQFFAEGIMNTTKVEYLNLSKNKFGEKAGIALGPAVSENSSIKHLDLSWNSIRRRGAVAIAAGLKQNVLMQKINLGWNGFGNDGAKALGDAMKANEVLEELDISNNRITAEGAVLLGKGLSVNEKLKTLKMGKNPMQSAGCYAVCAAILKNPNTEMKRMDFSDIMVNNDFLDLYKKAKEQIPEMKMRHGGDGVPKKPKARVHPMVKLKNYIEKHNMRLVDFFNKFDKDHSMSVTREEFAQGIEESGIKLTEDEITMLLDELDKDGDGEINYSHLVKEKEELTEKERSLAQHIRKTKLMERK